MHNGILVSHAACVNHYAIEIARIMRIIVSMKHYDPADLNNCTVMTRQQVRAFDQWAINELSIPGPVLMENAGRGCAEIICRHFSIKPSMEVSIFCGTGNNGGDGYVIARHLANAKLKPQVIICGQKEKVAGDALINLKIIEKMPIPIEVIDICAGKIAPRIEEITAKSDLVVDAIFGTGLQGQLYASYIELIEAINAASPPILAVDIPSGLDCDLGTPLPTAIKATLTVTFVAVKAGFTAPKAKKYTSQIYVASIGIEP